jgi:hypothetical protein
VFSHVRRADEAYSAFVAREGNEGDPAVESKWMTWVTAVPDRMIS